MIVNLTPHAINILAKESCVNLKQDPKTRQWVADEATPIRTIESSGVARVSVSSSYGEPLEGIPTQVPVYGEIEGLPDYKEGTSYIVSLLTVSAAKAGERTTEDLFTPGVIVRSAANQSLILGCFDLNRQ
jgi:hypothetical protein